MARSRSRSSAGGSRRATPSRQTKATSRKKAAAAPAAAEPEIVEEARGAGIETGIAVFTFLSLLVGILLLDHMLGTSYGRGVFFK